jgi:hypothetical protein
MAREAQATARRRPGCLVGSLLCGAVGFALLLLMVPDCGADSKQARMAKALSQERLASLHHAMKQLWAAIPEQERGFASMKFSGEKIPREFGGLHARWVGIHHGSSIIRLQGCFDHHLDLVFHGVGEPTGPVVEPPRIDLRSGEHAMMRTETLWRPAAGPSAGGSGNESGRESAR